MIKPLLSILCFTSAKKFQIDGQSFYADLETEESTGQLFMNVNIGFQHVKLFVSTRYDQLSVKSNTCDDNLTKQKTCFSERSYSVNHETAIKMSLPLVSKFWLVEQYEHKWPRLNETFGSYYNDIIKISFEDEDEIFRIDFQNFNKLQTGQFVNNGSGGDGILGLAPSSDNPDLQRYNFMDQLQAQGQIEHKIFSIYTSRNSGNSTHIRFGGYDENGKKSELPLTYIRTKNSSTWAVQLRKFSIGGKTINLGDYTTKTMEFDPAVPYLYVPRADFDLLAAQINPLLSDLQKNTCNTGWGECRILHDCSEVNERHRLDIDITIGHSDRRFVQVLHMGLKQDKLLVGGSTFKDAKKDKYCYLPIFRNDADTGNTQWVFGAIFMEKYYMVFDQSGVDQSGSYNAIGIAEKNEKDQIGYGVIDEAQEMFQDIQYVLAGVIAFCVILLSAMIYCFCQMNINENDSQKEHDMLRMSQQRARLISYHNKNTPNRLQINQSGPFSSASSTHNDINRSMVEGQNYYSTEYDDDSLSMQKKWQQK